VAFEFRDMTRDEIEEFLRAPRHAIVGTNRRDGPPQMTPVWYLFEEGRFYFSMYAKSAKYFNLRRDPRISLCITGDPPDARSVTAYGTAELHLFGSEDWIDEVNWRVLQNYCESDEEARELSEPEAGDMESALAVVTVDKMIAQDYN
jgi:PPOX class probable F420-dependent enzyme